MLKNPGGGEHGKKGEKSSSALCLSKTFNIMDTYNCLKFLFVDLESIHLNLNISRNDWLNFSGIFYGAKI